MGKKMMLVDIDNYPGFMGSRPGPMPFDEVKAYKKIKKMLRKEEEDKKKNAPKKENGLFKDWSVAKRTAFFAVFGPPLGIMYIGCIVLMVRGLAMFVVGTH